MIEIYARRSGILGKRVLCAVSGGKDSVALLVLLAEARDRGEIELRAAHFEHGIRGSESMEDMRFVKRLCEEKKVPLTIGRGNVPKEAEERREGLESSARRLRHEFLEKTRQKLECDFIALAHHRRDRAETVLMHLLRGGGLKGAAAMPEISGKIVRPLIDYSPEEIAEYLVSINQPWREDATNQIADNPRNALRLNVFPRLKEIYSGFESALSRFAEISFDENALIERMTDEFFEKNVTNFAGVWVIREGEKALMRRALKRIIPDSEFEAIRRALSARAPVDIGLGYSADYFGGHLYITPPLMRPKPVKLKLEGETELEGVCGLSARASQNAPILNNGYTQRLDASALKGAKLRLRQNDDFIKPFGLNGKSKTIGDYLTDRKFPRPLRDRLPLVAVENEILWVPGVGISESARLTKASSAIELSISISGGNTDA